MTVHIPGHMDEAVEMATVAGVEVRAGGTDVEARRRSGRSVGDVVDLRKLGLDHIDVGETGSTIGAMVRIGALLADDRVRSAYPALVLAAGSLANPHTRAAGTVGGNLLQRTRCPYVRSTALECWKTGGDDCHARDGFHRFGVVFDTGPCVAPHPSTIGMALLAYDATVTVAAGDDRTIRELYGDGSDPTADHLLERGAILTAVRLPAPTPHERAAYWRANARSLGEWPLVEAVTRLIVEDGVVTFARVAVGGVAPTPRRLTAVESAIVGEGIAGVEAAAVRSTEGAAALPQTRYKLDLLRGTVAEVLRQALMGGGESEATFERGL